MDKHILYLEIIFLASIVVNLIVPGMLFLKILLLLLTFLFFYKELDNYPYIRNKYMYVGIGFTSILFLFIVADYVTHIYFLVGFMCAVVAYLYLFKILFNETYGVVLKSTEKEITFKLEDPFLLSKKEYSLRYSKKVKVGSTVVVLLSTFFINKKPIKVKKVISK